MCAGAFCRQVFFFTQLGVSVINANCFIGSLGRMPSSSSPDGYPVCAGRAGGRADEMGQMRSLQVEAKRVREELQASTTVRLAATGIQTLYSNSSIVPYLSTRRRSSRPAPRSASQRRARDAPRDAARSRPEREAKACTQRSRGAS